MVQAMDRSEISLLAHADHPVAAPVSERRVSQLVERLWPPAGSSVVDLGCGEGLWLLATAATHPGVTCTGVDLSASALDRARRHADAQGIDARWVPGDAAMWTEGPYEAVICVGASHAFGGLDGTLAAVRRLVRPGGRVLIGDTIWERPPSDAAQQALDAGPNDFPDLAGIVERVLQHEFEVLDGHVSTLEEWDDYEWAWTGALTRWATSTAGTEADRADALHAAQRHRAAWVSGYRKELGFACLVLQDIRSGG